MAGDKVKKTYICVAFSLSGKKFEEICDNLPVNTFGAKKNSRYLLNYVADRIDTRRKEKSVCVNSSFSDLKDKAAIVKPYNSESVNITFGEVKIYCFSTKINIACIEIKFDAAEYFENISNAIFFLRSLDKGKIKIDGEVKSVKKILIEILKNNKLMSSSETEKDIDFASSAVSDEFARNNIFTYYEAEEKDMPLNDKMSFHLGHSYGQGFTYTEETDDKTVLYNNNGISFWSVASDSAACIAYPDKMNEGFPNIFRDGIENGYLLCYVLLHNQKYTLYAILNNIAAYSDNVDKLKEYRKEFYDFQLKFNFKTVSETPQYQNFYGTVYSAFDIDRLNEDVKEPLDAKETVLKDEEIEKQNEKSERINRLLIFISVLSIFSAFADLWSVISFYRESICNKSLFTTDIVNFIFTVLLLALMLIIWFGKRKKK